MTPRIKTKTSDATLTVVMTMEKDVPMVREMTLSAETQMTAMVAVSWS
jgi:hypothetical protein